MNHEARIMNKEQEQRIMKYEARIMNKEQGVILRDLTTLNTHDI